MGRLRQAQRTYNRTWRRVDKLYGQNGAPPPPVVFADKTMPKPVPGSAMWVANADDPFEMDTNEPRTVYITPGQRRVLGHPRTGFQGGRRRAQKFLLHEWRHMAQPPELVDDPNPWLRERDASLFARGGAKKMLRPRKRYGKRYVKRSQPQ